jgi:hypothetical protein
MPAPPAARASRPHRRRLQRRRDRSAAGRQDLERERLHRVAGEHRLGDAELHVHRRLAAAEHVVVHARQVVVDERIGVDQLDAQAARIAASRLPCTAWRRRARAAAAGACRRRAPRSASPRPGRRGVARHPGVERASTASSSAIDQVSKSSLFMRRTRA